MLGVVAVLHWSSHLDPLCSWHFFLGHLVGESACDDEDAPLAVKIADFIDAESQPETEELDPDPVGVLIAAAVLKSSNSI